MQTNILLATFCKPFQVLSYCHKLWEQFPNEERLEKIFLLKILGESQKVITYNITIDDDKKIDFKSILPKTVQIHRKKDTKTLYTINAINAIQLHECRSYLRAIQMELVQQQFFEVLLECLCRQQFSLDLT